MRCPNCRGPVGETDVFCPNCRYKLKDPITPRRGVRCPSGEHLMDPNWSGGECPYCEAKKKGAKQEQAPPPPPPAAAPPARNETLVSPSAGAAGRHTEVMPSLNPESRGPSRDQGRARSARIVGALLTYDQNRAGALYPIREGRNYLGAGNTREGHPCDICVPDDPEMSGEHALLLYRRGEGCVLYDQQSTNGTFLNGARVNSAVVLPEYARLRTGSTNWLFVLIDRETTAPPEAEPERKVSEAGPRRRDAG